MADVAEIAETMSNLEHETLMAFQACAKAFDAFDQHAGKFVRELLQENAKLREEIERLKGPGLIGFDAYAHADGSRECRPVEAEEDFKIGGSE